MQDSIIPLPQGNISWFLLRVETDRLIFSFLNLKKKIKIIFAFNLFIYLFNYWLSSFFHLLLFNISHNHFFTKSLLIIFILHFSLIFFISVLTLHSHIFVSTLRRIVLHCFYSIWNDEFCVVLLLVLCNWRWSVVKFFASIIEYLCCFLLYFKRLHNICHKLK